MNNLDKQYQDLLQTILDYGVEKKDRTGTGTKSIFGYTVRHNMKHGFPLLTTKKMYFKGIVTELLWFLRGDTNIKYLVDNDCHIWDGDAYKNYWFKWRPMKEDCGEDLTPYTQEEFINKIKTDDEFAKTWGELGPIYGKQWRNWCGYEMVPAGWNHGAVTHFKEISKCDQLANSINLLKIDPDSRRNRVSSWNVGELDKMTLPPCHTDFQFYTRKLSLDERREWCKNNGVVLEHLEAGLENEEDDMRACRVPVRAISLMWNQRSCDTFLGLPFNIASYGLLLEIIAKEVNMVPDELIGNLGDTHLYSNHIEQAKEQIGRAMTLEERIDYWFHKNKPNRDVVDHFDTLEEAQKIMYLDKGVPTRTREPYPLPKLVINDEFWNPDAILIEQINHIEISDFILENYQSHPTIKAPLSN